MNYPGWAHRLMQREDHNGPEGMRPDAQRRVDWTMVLADTLGMGTNTFVQWFHGQACGVIEARSWPVVEERP